MQRCPLPTNLSHCQRVRAICEFRHLSWAIERFHPSKGHAAEVIARAVANIAPGTPTAATVPVPAIESRDLLDDLDAVVGSDRVRLADVPALLRDLAPGWGPYRTLTGVQLRDQLDDAGVRTTNVGNVPRLDPADLHRALSGRHAEADDHEVS
jgi:S-DNA-T family DNA segregation ATPase FtsK/SpoIIIE